MLATLTAVAFALAPASYRTHDERTAALQALAARAPDLVRVTSIAKSREGRDVWLVEVASRRAGDPASRPAVFVAAGLEGDHRIGTEVAIAEAEDLVARAASDDATRRLLEAHAFYFVPCANPDGMARLDATPSDAHRADLEPLDDDRDGKIDEDAPEDLDGDGTILDMRVKDPAGEWIVSADDPRLVRKADRTKGERGEWKVSREGVDSDGDDALNEDGPGGVDLDRNFPHAFREHDPVAGPYALSQPESRAIADFLLAHRNVAAMLVYGVHDDLVNPPQTKPGQGKPEAGQPAREVDGDDAAYFHQVSEEYKKLTSATGAATPAADGALFQWGYFQLGVPSFAARVWTRPDPPKEKPAGDAPPAEGAKPAAGKKWSEADADEGRWLEWNDRESAEAFVPWHPFTHPKLGAVEIGGWKPGAKLNPPASAIAGLAEKESAFVRWLATQLPALGIAKLEATARGSGVYAVEAVVENSGYFPTALAQGVRNRQARRTIVNVGLDGATLLEGEPRRMVDAIAGSGGRETLRFVVLGKPGAHVTVSAESPKAGIASKTIELPAEPGR
jgi:murein tripeptide amidase MpaA